MHTSTLHGVLEYLRKLTDPTRVRELSDADLLERFRRHREEAAFTLLVQRHGPMVLSVCRRILGDVHEAEDAFQATFLVLVRNAAAIRQQQSLAAWLHGVASRIAHKARMRSARQREQQREAVAATVCDDPSATLAAAELRAALDEEIERLPAKYRTPLVLCYLADKTHEQAADELGWPKSSVTARLARARELLRQRMIRRGFTVPAGLLAVLLTEQTANAALPSLLTLSTVRLAVQTLAGETLATTSATALAGSFVKSTTALKLTTAVALLATLGLATVGYGIVVLAPAFPSDQRIPQAQALGEPRAAEAEPHKPRIDLCGDPLPDGAIARIGSGRMRHFAAYAPPPLAFTPDGKSIVSGGSGSLRIWDAATGKLQGRFNFDDATDWCLDFLFHEGDIIAASGRFNNIVTISVLDPAGGKLRRRMRMPDPFIMPRPIFSRDGKQIAYGHDRKTVRTYDATTGREILRIPVGKMPWAFGVAFAPDGKTVALCDVSDTIRFHDRATGKCVRELKRDGDKVIALSFSPDGRLLASLSNSQATKTTTPSRISIWNLNTGEERHRLKMPTEAIYCVAFSLDSKYLAAGGSHSEVLLWDAATGKEVRRYPSGISDVTKIAFSPDGKRIALRTQGGAIQLWEVAAGRTLPGSADPQLDSVGDLRFSSDGQRLLGRTDRYIAWDPATGQEIQRTAKVAGSRQTLALSPDESLLASTDPKGTIRVWEAMTGRPRHTLTGDWNQVRSCEFSPDGRRLVSQSDDKTIRVWDVASGRLHRFFSSGKEMRMPVISPDGRWLAAADSASGLNPQEITLWDLATGREKKRFAPASTYLHQLVFSPDSRLLAAVGDASTEPGEIAVWSIAKGQRWHVRDDHKPTVLCAAFSPDGRMLATGGADGSLFLWELASGRKRHQFIGHESRILSLAFSPDGRLLAAASPEAPVFVWDVFGALDSKKQRLSNDKLERCWIALAGEDAADAFQAIRRLVAAPEQTLPFFRQHLKPVPAPDLKRVRQLVKMLDSDDFSTRQKATEELESQADVASSTLRQIIANEKPSLEVRRRLQQIVESVENKPETLRAVRAVEVLEWIGTPEAVRLLGELANGAADARLTCEAAAARRRLRR
jgi:RNA polymerase sigma factor (sigma-70 family)